MALQVVGVTGPAAGASHAGTLADFLLALGVVVGVPVVILLATFAVSRFASRRLRSALVGTGFQVNVAILLSRTLWIAVWILGLLTELRVFGLGLAPLAAFIGVVGLAASLSLQNVLQNLVAGVYLLAERPFQLGDLITVIGPAGLNHEGTVEDIQMRTTRLRSHENDEILVPNAAVFGNVVTNHTAIGGYAISIPLTLARPGANLEDVRATTLRALAAVPTALTDPSPRLIVEKVGAETWTGSVQFRASGPDARSDAIWALGQAFPDGRVNDEASG